METITKDERGDAELDAIASSIDNKLEQAEQLQDEIAFAMWQLAEAIIEQAERPRQVVVGMLEATIKELDDNTLEARAVISLLNEHLEVIGGVSRLRQGGRAKGDAVRAVVAAMEAEDTVSKLGALRAWK